MDFHTLSQALADVGLRPRVSIDGKLEIVGDLSKITAPIKAALRIHKQAFLDLLTSSGDEETSRSLQLGSESYAYSVWDSAERLVSPIAIDTETELIQGDAIPRLALATASDGFKHRLIHPDDLNSFIEKHCDCHFVAHNATFDFEVISQAVGSEAWMEICDQGRLHDTMLLDSLIRIAKSDKEPINRNLGELAEQYLGMAINKDDPFRLLFGEIIGKRWEQVESGFFTYAIADTIATWKLWQVLSKIASNLVEPFKDQFLTGWRDQFGLLTETLQLKAAIALSQITRNGMRIDQLELEKTKQDLLKKIEGIASEIQTIPEAAGIFKTDRNTGELLVTNSAKPSIDRKQLIKILDRIAGVIGVDPPKTGKTNEATTSLKYWKEFASQSRLLALWVELEEKAKLFQFFGGLNEDQIHPRYTTLVRSGRTSCRSPNIQQLPRTGGFREMIVPSADHYFITIDYSFIELRTLASVCLRRFGKSRLAEVIMEGVDPHSHTAAMFEGVSIEEFNALTNHKELRQRAKALNFGIPGGLGVRSLITYAKSTYGVELSFDQANEFRQSLITKVYPELTQYLSDDSAACLSHNLKTTTFAVESTFATPGILGAARRIIAGKGKADGTPYSKSFQRRVWDSLSALNNNPGLTNRIASQDAGDRLSRDLFDGPSLTLTGRLRGKVGYSQARNHPFQALAADGAKIALWRLYREGFRCVAFVHDEVIIEIPIQCDHTEVAKKIDSILCESMRQLTGEVPIACEYALTNRWLKGAEAVFEKGKLQLWESGKI